MVATSEPDSKPAGTVRTVPMRPAMAMASMLGVWAASSGVLPPSSFKGSSAAPSGMMIAYFINSIGSAARRRLFRLVDDAKAGRWPLDHGQAVDLLNRALQRALFGEVG